jgi:hypothetical protein
MSDKENIWRKLTRLFRSGPVVRHKISRAEPIVEPIGTARAYRKQVSSLYVNSQAGFGQYERLSRYSDYHEMTFTPELSSGLDIYADEICATDENAQIIKIHSKDNEIKSILETLFFDIIDINFNIWSWARNMCKNGDFVLFIDANEDNGILNLMPIPINEIEREEGFDKDDPFAVRYRWLSNNNMKLENWQIIHFRLLGDDSTLPYGTSILEPARRIWRQLVLIEDAMLVYRIVRSPERRKFKIPVGNIPPEEVPRFIEEFASEMKRNRIVDPTTGRVDLRYNALSVDEDYFLPMRGDVGPDIDTLPGGQFTGDIDDVQYIQAKLFAAIKIPRAYLGYDQDVGSKATLAQEDVRFAKTIERIQKIVIAELNKIAIIHLFLMGYRGEDLTNFSITMSAPSHIAEQQKLELWRSRFEVAGMAQEGMFDRDTVRKRIFNLNDVEIEDIKEGQKRDKLFDSTIEGIQAPGPSNSAPGKEGEGEAVPGTPLDAAPGADELPKTLGGEEPGPVNASFELHGQTIAEDENPGSEGDDAFISTNKGKDLFSTHDDLYTTVFGTEKQTASDPYDSRAMSRLISKPFSEEKENEWQNIVSEGFEDLEETLKKITSSGLPKKRATPRSKKLLK